MANTDKQVQDLIDLVKSKKAAISKAEKPDWKTNCSFAFNPDSTQRYNIQTVSDIDTLVSMLAWVIAREDSHNTAAKLLGVTSKFKWCGSSCDAWQSDIQSRVNKIQISKNKADLELLESRLDKLISPEMKAKMELEEITKLLEKSQ